MVLECVCGGGGGGAEGGVFDCVCVCVLCVGGGVVSCGVPQQHGRYFGVAFSIMTGGGGGGGSNMTISGCVLT